MLCDQDKDNIQVLAESLINDGTLTECLIEFRKGWVDALRSQADAIEEDKEGM